MKLLFILFFGMIISCSFADSNFVKEEENVTFNIVTYNIRMNTAADGVNAWPLRKEKVAGLLKFHQADIFCVQEALPEQVDFLVSGFPEFENVGVGRDDGIRAGEHMSVFYRKARFEKLTDGMFWLSETPSKPGFGWDAVCNRTVTWIKLKDKMTNKVFFVFNTHFDHRGDVARAESAKLILKSIREINKENLPLILTGDFNLTKETSPIQLILTELQDSRDHSKQAPYGPEGTSGGFEVKLMPRTIDYIFIKGSVTVQRQGVLTDSFGLYYPSDHLPVLAEVQID
ncbi:MAG: endonuclease/exonuclease/phosphatase family protein [Prolixibacteraceae bacterium]|nr:endonuclease/exonuclease/phosphatase family protein [Prolixibacteraceae bacterium]